MDKILNFQVLSCIPLSLVDASCKQKEATTSAPSLHRRYREISLEDLQTCHFSWRHAEYSCGVHPPELHQEIQHLHGAGGDIQIQRDKLSRNWSQPSSLALIINDRLHVWRILDQQSC